VLSLQIPVLYALISVPVPTRSIKRYFLLEEGDFFEHFMDIAESELKKPVSVRHRV